MNKNMTQGPVMKTMLQFAIPMILGNLLQQCYNIADTLIVGKFLGSNVLAAVGSSFTLMTFITSILLGLCMGSGTFFSIRFGEKDEKGLKEGICASFLLILFLTAVINILSYLFLDNIQAFLKVPDKVWHDMRIYLSIIFIGIPATFLYNYFASLLRAIGNSIIPLIFLAVSAVLNIVLDLWFILGLHWGAAGAAAATVASQYAAGIGITIYSILYIPYLKMKKEERRLRWSCMQEIARFSVMTCIQQSVMNLGILLVQGVVNSFGAEVMAAFAAAVKIDAFAYMPVQDFGNAFSTFIAQNFGAKQNDRIRAGLKGAIITVFLFCLTVSAAVCIFARPLMLLFVNAKETAIIAHGVRYLRIEGSFYCGIGCLFLLYGFFRAMEKPGMSVVLTFISLGTRVALANILSAIPSIGESGIWWSVPIGWILADFIGFIFVNYFYLDKHKNTSYNP
ncbi:MAG: MATE family efflux transporter [Eubacterium sp.]|nr:MATE family efflux transporter [Eubacterium sp.]MCI8920169.1 MATE family efflux transporter [Eubacterium sp.]